MLITFENLLLCSIIQSELFAIVQSRNHMARKRFTFWLDDKKPTEADIAETIPALKSQRSFAKTIRDGIRLIVDLRNGNTDVLFELFPLLKAKLQADFGGNSGNGLTEDKIRTIIWEATNDPTAGIVMKSLPSGSHENNVLPVPSFDGLFDDDFKPMSAAEREADLKKREAEREYGTVKEVGNDKTNGMAQSSTNFASMIANMQSGTGGW